MDLVSYDSILHQQFNTYNYYDIGGFLGIFTQGPSFPDGKNARARISFIQ